MLPAVIDDGPIAPIRHEESSNDGEQNLSPEQDGTAQFLSAIQGIEAAIRDLTSEEDAEEREAEQRRNNANLRAQEEIALWTFWMTLAAGASTFLTFVGVFLIWRTLHYTATAAEHTKDMLVEAEKTTAAANRSVDETRRIGDAQTRAYLSFQCEVEEQNASGEPRRFVGKIENHGITPAFIIGAFMRYQVFDQGEDPKMFFRGSPGEIRKTRSLIFPKQVIKIYLDGGVGLNAARMIIKGGSAHLGYFVVYRDIFGKDRRTVGHIVCYKVSQGGGVTFHPYQRHNVAS